MKKIVCFLISAVLLAAMLSVFAVPASAAEDEGTLTVTEDMTLSGTHAYSVINVSGTFIVGGLTALDPFAGEYISAPDEQKPCCLTIESGAAITVNQQLYVSNGSAVTIESGATLISGVIDVSGGSTLTVKSGAKVTIDNYLKMDKKSTLTVESGATLICTGAQLHTILGSTVSIKSGATATFNSEVGVVGNGVLEIEPGAVVTTGNGFSTVSSGVVNFGGVLKGKWNNFDPSGFNFLPGGTVDVTCAEERYATELVGKIKGDYPNEVANNTLSINCEEQDGVWRVTAHLHAYPEYDTCCGEAYLWGDTGTGSMLSEGNLVIICTVAALVIGLGGGFFLGTKKKKKTATPDGESNK